MQPASLSLSSVPLICQGCSPEEQSLGQTPRCPIASALLPEWNEVAKGLTITNVIGLQPEGINKVTPTKCWDSAWLLVGDQHTSAKTKTQTQTGEPFLMAPPHIPCVWFVTKSCPVCFLNISDLSPFLHPMTAPLV